MTCLTWVSNHTISKIYITSIEMFNGIIGGFRDILQFYDDSNGSGRWHSYVEPHRRADARNPLC